MSLHGLDVIHAGIKTGRNDKMDSVLNAGLLSHLPIRMQAPTLKNISVEFPRQDRPPGR
jgi:hypothetical protein